MLGVRAVDALPEGDQRGRKVPVAQKEDARDDVLGLLTRKRGEVERDGVRKVEDHLGDQKHQSIPAVKACENRRVTSHGSQYFGTHIALVQHALKVSAAAIW